MKKAFIILVSIAIMVFGSVSLFGYGRGLYLDMEEDTEEVMAWDAIIAEDMVLVIDMMIEDIIIKDLTAIMDVIITIMNM